MKGLRWNCCILPDPSFSGKIVGKITAGLGFWREGKDVFGVITPGKEGLYKKVEKPVALNAIEPGVGRPKTMLVHLEKD